MFFVGIDLAWSEKNRSVAAIIKGQKDTADFVCASGERKAETLLKKMFALFHAVPYPSNRDLFLRLYCLLLLV
jgi:predicted RNase H-like nuclease